MECSNHNSIKITFPDGNIKEYPCGVTGLAIAQVISKSLAKSALICKIDGKQTDLTQPIMHDANFCIITAGDGAEALELIRHDTAHLLAAAVQELYPDCQVTIGPATKDGFYYDFARKEAFHPEDLPKIEAKMKELAKRNDEVIREIWQREDAIKFFQDKAEYYKAELIEAIPPGQEITLYKQGNFTDLCRGPHAPSTGYKRAFKLLKIAGAYWRGDSKNEMLQRIYGTAFATQKELDEYLHRIAEAEKRDHRKLGSVLNLFHIQEEASGQVFWHKKGWKLYRMLENYIRQKKDEHNYEEVKTPLIMSQKFWEESGHWQKFRENMFAFKDGEGDGASMLAIKPMNCPGHVQIFNYALRSYRELPLRIGEFGHIHRNEPSGSMHGLMRVRGFTQDDGHIFCTEEQIISETKHFCDLLQEVYNELGFTKIKVKYSDRPAVRAGEDKLWDKAESSLVKALKETGLEYSLNPGEGAFYGPKLEFVLTDAIGRDWQCGTFQVDFILPRRLDSNYIGKDGKKHRPVFLHCAVLGSFERFLGIMIEHYAGALPLWLAPVQAVICTITNDFDDYAKEVLNRFKKAGIRTELDVRSDKISYKIREHSLQKIPYIIAIGQKEQENGTLAIREFGKQGQRVVNIDEFMKIFQK